MSQITKESPRQIIDDFATEIARAMAPGPKPEKAVIDFRNEKKDHFERPICTIPIELLRFRKENGRISSDVSSYEKMHGVIDENDSVGQKVLADFLKLKDPDQTDILRKSILQTSQQEPAIITCDGFLINGNRRRFVLGMLLEETNNPEFSRMKVVILPGKNDPGGPPTIREIEQIENRYQLYKDGKSEYSRFDRAISVRRKIGLGMSLEEQLRDDPTYSGLSATELKREVKKYESEFLEPLNCADRYLASIGKPGMYTLVSSSVGGKENRWEAFIDYYNKVYKKLSDPTERARLGIEENDVAKIEAAAFNIIRVRDFSKIGTKVHVLMRNLPNYLKDDVGRKEIFGIGRIQEVIDDESKTPEDAEKGWINKNQTEIIKRVVKAKENHEHKDYQDKPVDLLRQALDKLNHDSMDTSIVGIKDLTEAVSIAEDIRDRADELKQEFYKHLKTTQDFLKGKGSK
jgi:hypothetical protein